MSTKQDKKYKFHLIPSGILNTSVHCLIGNGVVVHLRGFLKELATLKESLRSESATEVDCSSRIHISDRAHIVFDFHQQIDALNEKKLGEANKLGTTHKGIGPAYGSKVMRNGVRVGDLQNMEYFEKRLTALITQLKSAYPDLEVDVAAEMAYVRPPYTLHVHTFYMLHIDLPTLHAHKMIT